MSSTCAKRWITALVVLLLGSSHGLAATGTSGSSLAPTPLILKDGRIANVSVHVLHFPQEDATLGGRASRDLTRLTRENATDCFLTAQVIGHVGTDEVGEADTLRAHRLARSRADAVQASLIAGGLPAKSIASVWDWQFLVREPRATLWVFRLTEGEDCEGAPLEGAGPAVAQAATDPVSDRGDRATRLVAAPQPDAAAPGRQTRASRNGERGTADRVIPARSPVHDGVAPRQATSRAEGRSDSSARLAAVEPHADDRGPATLGSTEITFATNSSYFPSDARGRLEQLVAGMQPGERYQIRLKAAVSSSDQVVGAKSAEEAQRYNRWLAHRRLERIQNWLSRHAAQRDFTLETSFVENDNSRAVKIDVVADG